MSRSCASLSYAARREVLAHFAPRYQEASDAQKTLFLDQIVPRDAQRERLADPERLAKP